MLKTYPSVSIVFPNYNGGKEPIDCLKSIKSLNYPEGKIEVIVIDNNSTDGSDFEIKKKFPKVKLIKNKKNLGFAKAINQGIKLSKSKYIFIGNDDIIFGKNSLKNLLREIQLDSDIGAVGGKIYFKDNPRDICSAGYMMNKWTGKVYTAPNPNIKKKPDWLQGCAILAPKKILQKVGLLDPKYTLSFDDYDLCLRIRRSNFKVVYTPSALFWHGESKTVNKNLPHKYYHWYKSKFRFLIKNMPILNIISILFFQFFIFSPYRALILKDGRFWPFAKGLIWNVRNLRNTLSERKSFDFK